MHLFLGLIAFSALVSCKRTRDQPISLDLHSSAEPSVSMPMHLSKHRNPLGPSDKRFIRHLEQWRRSLLNGKDRAYDHIRPTPKEKPYRARQPLPLAWTPQPCSSLKAKWKCVATLHRHRRSPDRHNKVYLMEDAKDGKRYVYKAFGNQYEFLNEYNFLSVADHPNIVKPICYEAAEDKRGRPGLMMEWVEGGVNSLKWARQQSSPKAIKKLAAQLVAVTEYTHWLGFTHGDIKPGNLMVDGEEQLVVIDWGFAAPIGRPQPRQATPSTCPPEIYGNVVVDPDTLELVMDDRSSGSWEAAIHEGSSWWSVGVTIMMWYSGWVQEAAATDSHRYIPIRRNSETGRYEFSECPRLVPKEVREFVHLLTAADPADRQFNTKRLLEFLRGMWIFEGIRWDKLEGAGDLDYA